MSKNNKNNNQDQQNENLNENTQEVCDDCTNAEAVIPEDYDECCGSEQALQDEKDIRISELENEVAEIKDKYLRTAAEYDNFRKRTAKEKLDIYSDATIDNVKEILSVIDNFERAMNAETTDENFKNGMMMIFNQYKDVLSKLGVLEIDALNMPFDPNYHNAVNQVEDENFGENTISQVFQKGYKIRDKVIRHAMVTVANP